MGFSGLLGVSCTENYVSEGNLAVKDGWKKDVHGKVGLALKNSVPKLAEPENDDLSTNRTLLSCSDI